MSLRGELGCFFMGERFEAIAQALRLIARIPLIQRRGKCYACEEKAPSHSGFPLSTHVVLKTRHVNPNIHVRRY